MIILNPATNIDHLALANYINPGDLVSSISINPAAL